MLSRKRRLTTTAAKANQRGAESLTCAARSFCHLSSTRLTRFVVTLAGQSGASLCARAKRASSRSLGWEPPAKDGKAAARASLRVGVLRGCGAGAGSLARCCALPAPGHC